MFFLALAALVTGNKNCLQPAYFSDHLVPCTSKNKHHLPVVHPAIWTHHGLQVLVVSTNAHGVWAGERRTKGSRCCSGLRCYATLLVALSGGRSRHGDCAQGFFRQLRMCPFAHTSTNRLKANTCRRANPTLALALRDFKKKIQP